MSERNLENYPNFTRPFSDENGDHPDAFCVATEIKITPYGEDVLRRNIYVRWQTFRNDANFQNNRPMTTPDSEFHYSKSGGKNLVDGEEQPLSQYDEKWIQRPLSWYIVRRLLEAEAKEEFSELSESESAHPAMFGMPEVAGLLDAIDQMDAALSAAILEQMEGQE